jgi:NAD+ synthase (glutamine-hydrolysing)
MDYGFVKVASAIPTIKVADCDYNEKQIENLVVQAEGKGVEIICFPELCITGYTCGDLFLQDKLFCPPKTTTVNTLNISCQRPHATYPTNSTTYPRSA